ncbi:hypothetical protein KKA50_03500 [Patescibacteria group bacterium]|nr:hypothetical protein [Patescibacteria group bacterium]
MKYVIIIALFLIVVTGCTTNSSVESDLCSDAGTCNAIKEPSSQAEITVDRIEIYHFHGVNQCFSCKTVGEFAEKTVNTYYKDLLDSGKMTFASINAELPENKELAMKYEVTGSSLWIGTYIDGEFHKEENTNVWYKVRDEAGYLSYLKGVIDKRLVGDLS